jgi:hypothetical protein
MDVGHAERLTALSAQPGDLLASQLRLILWLMEISHLQRGVKPSLGTSKITV